MYPFCLVPEFWCPHEVRRSRGEVEFEGEPKHTIHILQEIQTAPNLIGDLMGGCCQPQPRPHPADTCSGVQKMWASSCWNRRTRVSPDRAPESSLRWRTPKSAIRRGSSRQERGRCPYSKLTVTSELDNPLPINTALSNNTMSLRTPYQ